MKIKKGKFSYRVESVAGQFKISKQFRLEIPGRAYENCPVVPRNRRWLLEQIDHDSDTGYERVASFGTVKGALEFIECQELFIKP